MLSTRFCAGTLIFSLLNQINLVIGHGFVHQVVINGQTYPAWNPFVDGYSAPATPRVGRKIPSDAPIGSISDPNLACNVGGSEGTATVADVNAGSVVTFLWEYWPGDHRGPVSTYMTACANNDCTNFNPGGAQWFKLDAAGYENGKWAAENLIADSFSWKSTVPTELAAGQYLMRHEIIALHSAYQPQFYPVCIQVNVVGSGSRHPSAEEMVTIPGLYDKTTWPNIDTQFGEFIVPGPPVVFSGGNTEPQPAPAPPSSPSTSRPSPSISQGPTPPSASSNSSIPRPTVANSVGRCRLVRRASH